MLHVGNGVTVVKGKACDWMQKETVTRSEDKETRTVNHDRNTVRNLGISRLVGDTENE